MVLGDLPSSILVAFIVVAAGSDFVPCEARNLFGASNLRGRQIPDDLKISHVSDVGGLFDSPDSHRHGTISHFSLPPLDSMALAPPPLDGSSATPPNCFLPPPPGEPAVMPSPSTYNPSPSPSESSYCPPGSSGPNLPKLTPSPPLYPAPIGHPPAPPKRQVYAVWCVAKPTVPNAVIQVAMDYACAAGADCKPIQPNGPCYQPDTLLSHASFAFNSYWQKKKQAGGTCDFGGTAMLVTVDPSFNTCHFDFS